MWREDVPLIIVPIGERESVMFILINPNIYACEAERRIFIKVNFSCGRLQWGRIPRPTNLRGRLRHIPHRSDGVSFPHVPPFARDQSTEIDETFDGSA